MRSGTSVEPKKHFIAPDRLKLWISLIFNFKSAKTIDNLENTKFNLYNTTVMAGKMNMLKISRIKQTCNLPKSDNTSPFSLGMQSGSCFDFPSSSTDPTLTIIWDSCPAFNYTKYETKLKGKRVNRLNKNTHYKKDIWKKLILKVIVPTKMNILSLITHCHVVSNLQDLPLSSEQKLRYFCWIPRVFWPCSEPL